MNKREIGAMGESIAESFLKKRGYKVIDKNYHASKLSEIDIVALDGKITVFVEVKLRTTLKNGYGREAVDVRKQEHIRYAAQHYMCFKLKKEVPVRFDVLEITLCDDVPQIELIQNAF